MKKPHLIPKWMVRLRRMLVWLDPTPPLPEYDETGDNQGQHHSKAKRNEQAMNKMSGSHSHKPIAVWRKAIEGSMALLILVATFYGSMDFHSRWFGGSLIATAVLLLIDGVLWWIEHGDDAAPKHAGRNANPDFPQRERQRLAPGQAQIIIDRSVPESHITLMVALAKEAHMSDAEIAAACSIPIPLLRSYLEFLEAGHPAFVERSKPPERWRLTNDGTEFLIRTKRIPGDLGGRGPTLLVKIPTR